MFSQSAVKWKCELTDSMRQVDDRLLSSQPTVSSCDNMFSRLFLYSPVINTLSSDVTGVCRVQKAISKRGKKYSYCACAYKLYIKR